jgi:hypothetical protein
MFFMAYSPQPTVAVETNYCSDSAPLDREKAGGRYAAGLSCNCRLAGRFRCFAFRIHR